MKRMILFVCFLLMMIALSCTKESFTVADDSIQSGQITAFWAADSVTRTEIQPDGTTLFWSGEERIHVFFCDKKEIIHEDSFVSPESEPRASAVFYGSIPVDSPWARSYDTVWSVYPGNAAAGCDGESVSLWVHPIQTSSANTIADNLFPAIATQLDKELNQAWDLSRGFTFYNVCGGTCFTVTETGISSVTFKSNAGEPIAGKIRAGVNQAGVPNILSIKEGIDSVRVLAPAGGFIPGEKYYAAFLPQTLSDGLSLTFRKGGQKAVYMIHKPIQVNRSRFGKLYGLDKGLTFQDSTPDWTDHADEIIEFADPDVKQDCVKAFDTNGDGELSYGEAAVVTSVEGAFKSPLYTEFNELRFFINLKSLPDYCFRGRSAMQTVSLPDGLSTIGLGAFSNCSSLHTIRLGKGLKHIGYKAFLNCSSLKNVILPDLPVWIDLEFEFRNQTNYSREAYPFTTSKEGHLFLDGEEIHELAILQGVTEIRSPGFQYCNSITKVICPSGLLMIHPNTFTGCNNIKTLVSPSLIDWLKMKGHLAFLPEVAPELLPSVDLVFGETIVHHLVIPEELLPELSKLNFDFSACSIEEITFPKGVHLASSVTFPFIGCKSLTRINLGSSEDWMEIGQYIPFEASGEGHIFVNGEELIHPVIPEGTTMIPYMCFAYCSAITDITIPSSVESTGSHAFLSCKSLTRVHYASIQDWLSIIFGGPVFDNVSGGHVLIDGEEVTSVVIPGNTRMIGNYTFYNCKYLDSIYSEPKTPPTISAYTFAQINCPVFVDASSYDAYMKNPFWKSIPTLQVKPD